MVNSWDEVLLEIKKWDMDETETKVFKLCLLWEVMVDKELSGELKKNSARLRKSGDPRKSLLFRYCWKLYRETKGLIPNNEYQLYIRAQLQIFKNLEKRLDVNSEKLPRIDPQILCGPKAWKRWMYWRNMYAKQAKTQDHVENIKAEATDGFAYKVGQELAHTKEFLLKQSEGKLTREFIQQISGDRTLLRWVTFGKVSPYYIVLSPWVNSMYEGSSFEKANNLKLGVYVETTNEAVQSHFKEHFGHEQ